MNNNIKLLIDFYNINRRNKTPYQIKFRFDEKNKDYKEITLRKRDLSLLYYKEFRNNKKYFVIDERTKYYYMTKSKIYYNARKYNSSGKMKGIRLYITSDSVLVSYYNNGNRALIPSTKYYSQTINLQDAKLRFPEYFKFIKK